MSKTSKSALANELAGPVLTCDDIAAFLVAYYGAVALDQARVDQLRRDGRLRNSYDRKEWKLYRKDYLIQLERLLDTLLRIPQETLAELTVLAATSETTVMRGELLEMLTNGTCAHVVSLPMYDAPEFFYRLVEEAERGDQAPEDGEVPARRMMRWFDAVDPLRISRKGGYKKSMLPNTWS